jgi:hypothetical protein
MALPKKGLRRITVDGAEYVWMSKCVVVDDDEVHARLVVQRRGHSSQAGERGGQLLLATVYDVTTIDQGIVAWTIRWAIKDLGWTPDQHNNTPLKAETSCEGLRLGAVPAVLQEAPKGTLKKTPPRPCYVSSEVYDDARATHFDARER